MRERVKLDEAAGLRGESIEERGVGRGSTADANSAQQRPGVAGYGGKAIRRQAWATDSGAFDMCPTERAKLLQDSASCARAGADHGGRVHDESNQIRGR